MRLVCLSGKTAIISLNSINRFIFVMVMQCVYCEVGTESLNVMYTISMFQVINRHNVVK
jgi:hypothetical protein